MDQIAEFSQKNNKVIQGGLNSQSNQATEKDSGEGFDIKIPPSGVLDSSDTLLNSDRKLKSDKNIKIDLDLNNVPLIRANDANNTAGISLAPKKEFQSGQLEVKDSTFQSNTDKKNDLFKLSSSELQGPKPPLVSNNNRAFIFVVLAIVALSVLAVGGYYLTHKNGDDIPVVDVLPSGEPSIDITLDSDSDTMPDAVEKAIGTNPNKMDTDGDSFNDLPEIKNGYSPLITGGAGKYTPQQLQILMDKIKAADKEFYEKEFEKPVVSKSPILSPSPVAALTSSPAVNQAFIYPDDYKLKDNEIPVGFQYKPIGDEERVLGLNTNPGYLSRDNFGEIIYPLIYPLSSSVDPIIIKDVYVSTLISTTKQSELGFLAIKFNYESTEDFVQGVEKITPKKGYIYLRDDKNILIIISSISSIYSAEINDIAVKLQSRLGLKNKL